MPISINGSGTVTGVSVGGLPDGIVDADMLASNSVQTAKIVDDAVTDAKQDLSGAAKVWCNLNGTGTIAVRDSFGLSSVTDQGQGLYQFNFSPAFANTNYCVLTGQSRKQDNDSDDRFFTKSHSYTTGSFQIEHAFAANDSQNSDSEYVFVAVMS